MVNCQSLSENPRQPTVSLNVLIQFAGLQALEI